MIECQCNRDYEHNFTGQTRRTGSRPALIRTGSFARATRRGVFVLLLRPFLSLPDKENPISSAGRLY